MTIPELPPATLRLRIDTAALADNWRALNRLSGNAEAGAAVKANGYGLGIDHVMPALLDAGARQFFVAHWSEVPGVLAHTHGRNIAVLHGVLNAREAAFAKATGVLPVINSLYQAQVWLEAGGGPCHLMVDTGMNRLGVETRNLADPAIRQLKVDTLLSHLASADEDTPQNDAQLQAFWQASQQIEHKALSLANSAGIALGADYHFDLTRPGLALYGGIPRSALADVVKQVAFIEAAVLQVRELGAGDKVGYNAVFTAPRSMRAATISLGYADGILRSWGAEGAMQHMGQSLPIIGRVSMDMVILDCSDTDLAEGDFLNLSYDLPQASRISSLSQYELLTLLGKRFERVT